MRDLEVGLVELLVSEGQDVEVHDPWAPPDAAGVPAKLRLDPLDRFEQLACR
jgi:hypothetical protein